MELREVLVQTFQRTQVAWEDRAVCDYAATTAVQMAGIVVGRPDSLPTLNCCFRILLPVQFPLIVTAAVWNRLNPSIGRIRCFTRR